MLLTSLEAPYKLRPGEAGLRPPPTMSDFGEVVNLTASLSAILRRYPFGIGLFREILQNSDDAKATKQVGPNLVIARPSNEYRRSSYSIAAPTQDSPSSSQSFNLYKGQLFSLTTILSSRMSTGQPFAL